MHTFTTRIYYEDTDALGIVYHANTLKFAERARTEWLRSLGFDQSKIIQEKGAAIVVHRIEIDYLSPAKLDDILTITTALLDVKKVTLTIEQSVKKESIPVAQLKVYLACINKEGRPTRIPPKLLEKIQISQ